MNRLKSFLKWLIGPKMPVESTRTCFSYTNTATNPSTAPIPICDKCFDRLQERLQQEAQGRGYQPTIVSYDTYKKMIKKIKNE